MIRNLPTLFLIAGWPLVARPAAGQDARILDLKFQSQVFGEERNFRVFLPPGYDQAAPKRYPVVYFFHGWSERHNRPPRGGLNYDTGTDYGGDTIARFVGSNDVIVVKWDGANPRTPGEEYVRPYNISPVETDRQFPLYFPELARHIDSTFRTLADREHRATAGLSMGGFMSFWIAGKYPHLIGSASNFMGSSEFVVGPKAFPTEYRHDEMYRNYEGMRTRIVLGSKDFIRWYHRRMNLIWDFARPYHEHEEFDSEHGTPGMGKTLAFHMAAFREPLSKPSLWHHADVYPDFDVWGWSVSSDRKSPGYTALENVSRGGFRSAVREWLPGGRTLPRVTLRITTEASYRAGKSYRVTDVNLDTGQVRQAGQAADSGGRLHFQLSGDRHEVAISEASRPILAVAGVSVEGAPWATAGKPVRVKFTLLNKGSRAAPKSIVTLSSRNPQVTIQGPRMTAPPLEPGKRAEAEGVVVAVSDPRREVVQLRLQFRGGEIPIELPLFPDVPALAEYRVVDGARVPLWERAIRRVEKRLGAGNGDGKADAGETIVIAVPGGDAYRAVELFSSDSCVDLTARLSDPWGDYDHVGASAKISLARIRPECPAGHEIPFFARYQIPDKPEHKLKEGVVRVTVTASNQP